MIVLTEVKKRENPLVSNVTDKETWKVAACMAGAIGATALQ
jgi:hypothetical protein